jgi:hypothetical protein
MLRGAKCTGWSFTAMVGSRVVTRSFQQQGALRVAVLRYGGPAGLAFGRSTLYVRTASRRGFAQSSFVVARRIGGLLGSTVAYPTCAAGAKLNVRLVRRALGLRVWIHGRATSIRARGLSASVDLDADNGLRPGVNQIRIRVLDATGSGYSVRRLRLVMPLSAPVAGAGPSRRSPVGRRVRFDADASAPARGNRLRYRWAIVQAPPGSRARLLNPTRRRSLLRPDQPGRYVLRVTVTHLRRSAQGARLRGQLLCAGSGSSSDLVSLTAPVSSPPIGVPVDTIDVQNGMLGVNLGADTTTGGGFYPVQTSSDALQLVVLDRDTLGAPQNGVIQNRSYRNDSAGASQLLSDVKTLVPPSNTPSPYLVILTKPDPTVTNVTSSTDASSATTTLNQALNLIGAPSLPIGVLTSPQPCGNRGRCGTFSAIGIPGLPVGQGDVNPGLASASGSACPPVICTATSHQP